MATMNPLERKARNSFIKGIIVAGLIGVIGIVILGIIIMRMRGEEQARLDAQKDVYVLRTAVQSGTVLTQDMFTTVGADAQVAPSDALNMSTYNTLAYDEEGNELEVVAKIDIAANTIVTTNMLTTSDNINTDDVRQQEYNMISLPADLETGDIVDVRLRLADGTDYIVVSKKSVTVLDQAGIPSVNTISLELSEGETLMMSNAIVESYMMEGSRLYLARYVEPGMQAGAITTYVPSGDVQNLIAQDPNIVNEAKQELVNRINAYGALNRSNINDELNTMDADDRASSVASGTNSEISDAHDARQSYLDSMQIKYINGKKILTNVN